MSALNVLSKHFGGLPRLPLRLVMTVRAICAGVLDTYESQGGVVWTIVCLWTGYASLLIIMPLQQSCLTIIREVT